ncbi:MAG: asparagine synthetase B, partial [Bacteroidia bacterium]|nr:asparagine synthetase B [Bacteroidia bacterium]
MTKLPKIGFFVSVLMLVFSLPLRADYLLIPMDKTQTDHLKAYGVAYWVLAHGVEVEWMLNYRGGSFCCKFTGAIETELQVRDVRYEKISDSKHLEIIGQITSESVNMDVVKLEKAPKIAVYSPKSKQPWDDAVTLVLTYAEIPYDLVYDTEVMDGKLAEYDWLHLHHEDFTGQYGKFWAQYHNTDWYQEQVAENEAIAKKYGFTKVSRLKLAVAKKIREFVESGKFLFAMCSATDTYDIAMAAEDTDICEQMYDGDPADPKCQEKLDFSKGFAFHNYTLERNPLMYEHSNIDATY